MRQSPCTKGDGTAVKRFNRIHAVCVMLRRKPCDGCSAWERFEGVDPFKGKRGCRALAEETVNIAAHGNPWGKKHRREGVCKWRKRFNRE